MTEKHIPLPDFAHIQNCLELLGAITECAEAHGSLCGLLIDNRGSNEWITSILNKSPASNDLLANEHINELIVLYQASKQQINAADLSLELFLPTDDQTLATRLQALSDWCKGFLYGLGCIGKIDQNPPTEVAEFMNDLLGITQIEIDENSCEETEQDYAEVVEYVRMGVIYMNDILNPVITPAESIH